MNTQNDEPLERSAQPPPDDSRPRKGRPSRPAVIGVLVFGCLAVATAGAVIFDSLREPKSVRQIRAFLASLPKEHYVERNGKQWLWAGGHPSIFEKAEWFDVTGATLPPRLFNHGIGKDRIAAIDDAVFVEPDDPRLAKREVGPESAVIGYEYNGQAKAYPIKILATHELANDTVGGKPVTVGY